MDAFKMGNKIYIARKKKRLNQAELAEKTGISTQMISNYENGLHYPALDRAAILAKALEISLDWLVEEGEV